MRQTGKESDALVSAIRERAEAPAVVSRVGESDRMV